MVSESKQSYTGMLKVSPVLRIFLESKGMLKNRQEMHLLLANSYRKRLGELFSECHIMTLHLALQYKFAEVEKKWRAKSILSGQVALEASRLTIQRFKGMRFNSGEETAFNNIRKGLMVFMSPMGLIHLFGFKSLDTIILQFGRDIIKNSPDPETFEYISNMICQCCYHLEEAGKSTEHYELFKLRNLLAIRDHALEVKFIDETMDGDRSEATTPIEKPNPSLSNSLGEINGFFPESYVQCLHISVQRSLVLHQRGTDSNRDFVRLLTSLLEHLDPEVIPTGETRNLVKKVLGESDPEESAKGLGIIHTLEANPTSEMIIDDQEKSLPSEQTPKENDQNEELENALSEAGRFANDGDNLGAAKVILNYLVDYIAEGRDYSFEPVDKALTYLENENSEEGHKLTIDIIQHYLKQSDAFDVLKCCTLSIRVAESYVNLRNYVQALFENSKAEELASKAGYMSLATAIALRSTELTRNFIAIRSTNPANLLPYYRILARHSMRLKAKAIECGLGKSITRVCDLILMEAFTLEGSDYHADLHRDLAESAGYLSDTLYERIRKLKFNGIRSAESPDNELECPAGLNWQRKSFSAVCWDLIKIYNNLCFIWEPYSSDTELHNKKENNLQRKQKALALYQTGKFEELIQMIGSGGSEEFDDIFFYFMHGDALQKLNKNDEAIRILQKGLESSSRMAAIQDQPIKSIILQTIGFIYWNLGKTDQAKESYEVSLELNPKNASSSLMLGLIEIDKQNYERAFNLIDFSIRNGRQEKNLAISTPKEIIESVGKNITISGGIYELRGQCLMEMGRNKEAIQDFKKALSMGFVEGDSYAFIGLIYFNLNNYHEAEKWISKAIKGGTFNNELYKLRGLSNYSLQNHELAISDLDKCVTTTTDIQALSIKSISQCIVGDHSGAIRSADLIEKSGDSASANQLRGTVFFDQDRMDEAKAAWKTALEFANEANQQGGIQENIAMVAIFQNELDKALRLAINSNEKDPNLRLSWYIQLLILTYRGNHSQTAELKRKWIESRQLEGPNQISDNWEKKMRLHLGVGESQLSLI